MSKNNKSLKKDKEYKKSKENLKTILSFVLTGDKLIDDFYNEYDKYYEYIKKQLSKEQFKSFIEMTDVIAKDFYMIASFAIMVIKKYEKGLGLFDEADIDDIPF